MEQIQSREYFINLVMGYRSAKVLLTAHKLRIFEVLGSDKRDPAEIATRTGCSLDGTLMLLRALAAMKVLRYEDGKFGHTLLSSTFLIAEGEQYVGHTMQFLEMLWECWSHLDEVVKTGKPWKTLLELLSDQDQEFTRQYIRGMQPISKGPASEVARILSTHLIRRMLDVGGGTGAYALALAETQQEMGVVILDLPGTLSVTRELIDSHPNRGRIELRPGNYLTDDFGENFDLILMSFVTHDESPTVVRKLIQKAFNALRPNGRLAIHNFTVNESGTEPLWGALFSVNVMVYTAGGRVYSKEEYDLFMRNAGFAEISSQSILEGRVPNHSHLIIGTKGT